MSAFSAWRQSLAGVVAGSIVLVPVAKLTVLLAVAWLAHGMLAGRNPRWRVALWRATLVGVVLVAVLSLAPPIVKCRFEPAAPATAEVARSDSSDPMGRDQRAVDAIVGRAIKALDRSRVSAPVERTGSGADGGSISAGAQEPPSGPALPERALRGTRAAWRVREAHAEACDAVCDAVAVDVLGDAVSYGKILAERYIKQNGLIWTHGFAGILLAGVSAGEVYKVRSIPATFLIGPDGRILAKNLRGGELKAAVRKALQDPNLFPTTDRTKQRP